ncbi:transporter substrate-binding domain-containing protein [Ideonella sp. DXS29W]|uniref:Transporter substrate-binding domain-containing protein n=1 Tax=Ideonella lacteola TaxID=2984193 RepID=A0ABU9BSF2_9BURK
MRSRSDPCSPPAGWTRRRWCGAALGLPLWAAATGARAQPDSHRLARIRERGSLIVGLYQDMPPFHADGRGIDMALGQALAQQMGLGFRPLPFQAGENMGDDLRNMVWKGHYLGWGPADVLLHVPLERALMAANPQVQVVAPYYRERVLIAWAADAAASVESLADLRGLRVAVCGQSLAGWLLAGAEGGALQGNLVTAFADGVAAAQSLREGRADAVAGLASELESVLAHDARFRLQPLPSIRFPREGWAVGCAVRADADDLAQALQAAMLALQSDGRLATLFRQSNVDWRL